MDGENAGNPEILDETNKTMEQESRDLPLTMSEQIDSKENIEHNFHTMIKVWRKQINYLQIQLVNNCEITCLQNECRILEECMYNHSQAHEALETTTESSVEKIALYGKFEDMSRENNMVMRQVHQAIRDLKMDYLETNTQLIKSRRTNRSAVSRRSGKSFMSGYSKGSTSSSARQRRLDLEEEAAILKAKMCLTQEKEELGRANQLALVEIEGKILEIQQEEERIKEHIELSKEKFRIKEELAQAEARIEVCYKIRGCTFSTG
jgi:hypothetical protein